jgi:hypothetical protein
MKNIQLVGLILVIIGSFLPLVHVPVVGNWNYWDLNHYLAITCWILSACAIFGIMNNTIKIGRILEFYYCCYSVLPYLPLSFSLGIFSFFTL